MRTNLYPQGLPSLQGDDLEKVRIGNKLLDSRELLEKPNEPRALQHAKCGARRRPHELLFGEIALFPLQALIDARTPPWCERVAFGVRWKLRGERAHQLGGEDARAAEHDVREHGREMNKY